MHNIYILPNLVIVFTYMAMDDKISKNVDDMKFDCLHLNVVLPVDSGVLPIKLSLEKRQQQQQSTKYFKHFNLVCWNFKKILLSSSQSVSQS